MTHDGKAFLPGATGRLVSGGSLPVISGTFKAAVYVEDVLTIFPELAVEGESDHEFARKVQLSAELARKEDAYEELRSRVFTQPEDPTIKRFQERADASRDNGIDLDCGA